MTEFIKPGQLAEMVREPNVADALEARAAMALDLRDAQFDEEEAKALNDWLARQPLPVVALASAQSSLLRGLDLLAETEQECSRILGRIAANPHAAAVLVQVTRATQSLSVFEGLWVESLGYATLQAGAEFARWREDNCRDVRGTTPAEPLHVERDGADLRICLNDPESRNALSVAMRDALASAFKLAAMDDSIGSVRVSGEGPCFCAGGDLAEFGQTRDAAMAHHIRGRRMPAMYLASAAAKYTFHLHGACIGAGIELPSLAGRIEARPDTFFRLPEVGMGLIPGAGGCVGIPRRIGRHRANLLAITGMELGAEQALEWGLVDEIE